MVRAMTFKKPIRSPMKDRMLEVNKINKLANGIKLEDKLPVISIITFEPKSTIFTIVEANSQYSHCVLEADGKSI